MVREVLLSPLVSEGSVLVVLAGRLPAPIRLVEVRRYLKVWPLEPLPVENEARELVREVLAASPGSSAVNDPRAMNETRSWQTNSRIWCWRSRMATRGFRKRSREYLADPVNREPADSLRRRVAEEVVRPFIDREILSISGRDGAAGGR